MVSISILVRMQQWKWREEQWLRPRPKGRRSRGPCSEGVNWFVMAKAIEVSTELIGQFEGIASPSARPLQGLNDRLLIASQ